MGRYAFFIQGNGVTERQHAENILKQNGEKHVVLEFINNAETAKKKPFIEIGFSPNEDITDVTRLGLDFADHFARPFVLRTAAGIVGVAMKDVRHIETAHNRDEAFDALMQRIKKKLVPGFNPQG